MRPVCFSLSYLLAAPAAAPPPNSSSDFRSSSLKVSCAPVNQSKPPPAPPRARLVLRTSSAPSTTKTLRFQRAKLSAGLTRGYWFVRMSNTSTDNVRRSSNKKRSPPNPPVDSLMPKRPATGPTRLPSINENRSCSVVVTVVDEFTPVSELFVTCVCCER